MASNEQWEEHPAFGMVSASRVSSSQGVSLFDSEIRHQHYVVLRIHHADRKRELNRDWIHPTKQMVEISLSQSQWAALVSSMNTTGTPCTLSWTAEDGRLPEIPFEPRLQQSQDEVRDAANRAFRGVQEAFEVYKNHKTVGNLRILEAALNNAGPNVTYAAKSLTEHTENVVQKAKADIEAMVDSRARQLGLDPTNIVLELE